MGMTSVATAVVAACALALTTVPAGAVPTTAAPTAHAAVSAGVPLVVHAAKKPRATVTPIYTTLPNGKVFVQATSNATKVQVMYRTAKNKKRTATRKVKRGAVTITLPVGSKSITVRAKATSKLASSPWTAATPPAPPAPPTVTPAPVVSPPVVTPPAPDTTAPGQVTGLQVSGVTATSLTLSWTNPTDADLAAVIVHRDGVLVYEGPATTYTDSGLTPETDYGYAVFTRDATGNTSAPATSYVTTAPPADTQAPPSVGTLRVTATTSSSATIEWDYPVSPPDLAGFVIRRGQQTVGSVGGRSFTEAGLSPATTYEYSVVAVDKSGNESPGEKVSATTKTSIPNTTVWRSWFPDLGAGTLNTFDPEVALSDDGAKGLAVWSGTTSTRVSSWDGAAWSPATDLPSMGSATQVDVGLSPDGSRATLIAGFSDGASHVARTRQNGVWTAGTKAYQPANGYHVEYPKAAFSADAATAVTVWSEVSNTPGSGTDRVLTAVWNGTSWTAPTALSADVPHFSLPHVAVSADGTRAVAVWTANTGIQASQWDGTSWSAHTTVAPGAYAGIGQARVAIAADGSRAVVIIEGSSTSAALFDGTQWSTPQQLSAMGSRASIAISDDGSRSVALWIDSGTSELKSATLLNSTWGTPVAVASIASPYTTSIPDRLLLSSDGTRAASVWRDGTTIRSSVMVQGDWSAAKAIGSASTNTSNSPSLAISGAADARTIAAAWIEQDPLTKTYTPTLGIGQVPTP